MVNDCQHGEPRGAVYCALCRRAGVQGKAPDPANQPWETRALRALMDLRASRQAFTSEDITDRAGYPNANRQNANNKIGLFIQRNARKYGLRKLRMERARNPQSNGRLIQVWIGE